MASKKKDHSLVKFLSTQGTSDHNALSNHSSPMKEDSPDKYQVEEPILEEPVLEE